MSSYWVASVRQKTGTALFGLVPSAKVIPYYVSTSVGSHQSPRPRRVCDFHKRFAIVADAQFMSIDHGQIPG